MLTKQKSNFKLGALSQFMNFIAGIMDRALSTARAQGEAEGQLKTYRAKDAAERELEKERQWRYGIMEERDRAKARAEKVELLSMAMDRMKEDEAQLVQDVQKATEFTRKIWGKPGCITFSQYDPETADTTTGDHQYIITSPDESGTPFPFSYVRKMLRGELGKNETMAVYLGMVRYCTLNAKPTAWYAFDVYKQNDTLMEEFGEHDEQLRIGCRDTETQEWVSNENLFKSMREHGVNWAPSAWAN